MENLKSHRLDLPEKGLCLVYPVPSEENGNFYSKRISELAQLISGKEKEQTLPIYILTSHDAKVDIIPNDFTIPLGDIRCSNSTGSILKFILGDIKAQIRIFLTLLLLIQKIDLIFWKARPCTIILPLLTSKVMGKKSIILVEGRGSEIILSSREQQKRPFRAIFVKSLSRAYGLIECVIYSCADKMAVNVPSILNEPWIFRYRHKMFPCPIILRYVSENFHRKKVYDSRNCTVGFVGRMSEEKGIRNFVEAIKMVHESTNDVNCVIIGDGPLAQEVNIELNQGVSEGWIKILPWISSENVPEYLNEMKLLVMPSYYEGSPNIVLEAMACGTPVLSTPVGAVPDIIKDGTNGYLMKNNSSKCIAENIIRVLKDSNANKVAENGYEYISNKYSYDALREEYVELVSCT